MSNRFLGFLLLMIPVLLLSPTASSKASARKFDVEGKEGWVVKPSENYNQRARRKRFQVNDALYFKYAKGSDSVLVVKKEDYDSCNNNNPLQKMDDGDSTFLLDNSGLFFYISGNANNCKNDQMLIVLIMAVRHNIPQSPPPVVPSSEAPIMPPAETNPSSLDSPVPSLSNGSSFTRLGGFIAVGKSLGVGVILIVICLAGLV